MANIHAVVHGAVQGVGFRSFVHQEAQKNHLHGWVRNREDGAVEIAAEGDSATLENFIETVKKGNTFSRVEQVNIEDDVTVHHNQQFSIRY
ncbi:acylphosphatase [Natribacillus halophilus]|uniref:Acylphosphatase n=1 Tax=Natribacillus halophilus TaxID=549003 RepID=A0A1G8NUL3_9BACI|nr:acylphosphatase [Natribacillus halophilus]SDI83887.1 acylphosphatase [Natribacillus halophilus]